MNSNLFILHKHAVKYIAIAFALSLLFLLLDLELLALLGFGVVLFLAYTFRNPERELQTHEKNAFVSPVDGLVLNVEYLEDNSFNYKVSIASSYQDISVLRVPYRAKVQNITSVKGARLSEESKLFELLNEYKSFELVDEAENRVKIVHRVAKSFAPISLDIKENEELLQGKRYGTMLRGVTTIYLPKSFKLHLRAGVRVSASETLFGYFS